MADPTGGPPRPRPAPRGPAGGRRDAELADLLARFGVTCRQVGLPVGPERTERFARAVLAVDPATTARLRDCALATLVCDPAQIPLLDRVLDAVFGGLVDPAGPRGDPTAPDLTAAQPAAPDPGHPTRDGELGGTPRTSPRRADAPDPDPTELPTATLASAADRPAERAFDELSADELRLLADTMRRFRLLTPPRRTRRTRPAAHGRRVDLRASLRAARRTGGDPVTLLRKRARDRPRRLVVLCDISGSMEPWSRALLQLLWCARAGSGAEVFTFATRLTRLTRALARSTPGAALDRASALAPDWSGGTRIGEALARFLDGYGARGMARGAVVLIVSDGWETGDPEYLGRQMARLSRLAHRIVWANPRTRHADYRPLAGGMAAAWPHCDAVVSAHSLTALDELLAALATSPRRRRSPSAAGGPVQARAADPARTPSASSPASARTAATPDS